MSQLTLELPPDLLDVIVQKAAIEQKAPQEFVTELLREQLQLPQTEFTSDFEREVATFERLKPTLLEKYPGQFVAIYGGKVVGVDADEMTLFRKILRKFGPVACYIEKVVPVVPRRVRMPSTWVKTV